MAPAVYIALSMVLLTRPAMRVAPARHVLACGSAFYSSAGGTRTCIHTPGEPLDPAELALPCSRIRNVLDGAALVYFDGRLAEAALLLAGLAVGCSGFGFNNWFRLHSHWKRKTLRSAPFVGMEQGFGTEPVSSVPILRQNTHTLRECRAGTGKNAQCERTLKILTVN